MCYYVLLYSICDYIYVDSLLLKNIAFIEEKERKKLSKKLKQIEKLELMQRDLNEDE
jgi:hypothetical protein